MLKRKREIRGSLDSTATDGKLDGLVKKYLPNVSLHPLAQDTIPRIAKDRDALKAIAKAIKKVHTCHTLYLGDARLISMVPNESVHLVVTSPPYFDLKRYPEHDSQLGGFHDYEAFLKELDRVWSECYRILVKGGRLIIVVGDVCRSRRAFGAHMVIPLHASIIEHYRYIGFHNQRKPGAYRRPSEAMRLLSVIDAKSHREWFKQIVSVHGASTRSHPSPYPTELTEPMIRMFSFVGDVVLDPFSGTATTSIAAVRAGRNSIGIEIEPSYHSVSIQRLTDTIRREKIAATVTTL